MSYIFNIFIVIIITTILLLSKHFKIFLDNKVDKHKKFVGKNNSYFLGGLIIFIFLFYDSILKNDFYLFLLYFLFFVIGLLSDLKILNSPNKRLLIQFISLLTFVALLDIKILETRFGIVDILLQNNSINYFFVTFCLIILINGCNFIDGINNLLISYVLIIFLLILIYLGSYIGDKNAIINLAFVIIILLVFNLFGIIILGDSGSYLLSLFLGLNLIELNNSNILISPYFIILLLWYPCFELLFSIIRRSSKGKVSYNPDTNHLHQMLYRFISSSNNLKQNLNHFITSFIIIFYNLFSFIIGIKFYSHTETLIYIVTANIIVYLVSYNFLKIKLKK